MKIPCTKCGAEILPSTAERTGGLCMACKQGIRESIEASKKYYEERKQYDPYRALWHSLVERVYKTDDGFEGLNSQEKLYYAVCVLDGEVYNGGIHQFFSNSSGSLYECAVSGLKILGAAKSLELLLRAKALLFGDAEPPVDRKLRWEAMEDYPDDDAPLPAWAVELEEIDNAFWQDPDSLGEKLTAFAKEKGLVLPFLHS